MISWALVSLLTMVTRPPTLMMTLAGCGPSGVNVIVAVSGHRYVCSGDGDVGGRDAESRVAAPPPQPATGVARRSITPADATTTRRRS